MVRVVIGFFGIGPSIVICNTGLRIFDRFGPRDIEG